MRCMYLEGMEVWNNRSNSQHDDCDPRRLRAHSHMMTAMIRTSAIAHQSAPSHEPRENPVVPLAMLTYFIVLLASRRKSKSQC